MATSSITKNFVAKDKSVYEKLAKDIKAAETKKTEHPQNTSWKRGQELLKRFSFH